jgi:hypothetical protein
MRGGSFFFSKTKNMFSNVEKYLHQKWKLGHPYICIFLFYLGIRKHNLPIVLFMVFFLYSIVWKYFW